MTYRHAKQDSLSLDKTGGYIGGEVYDDTNLVHRCISLVHLGVSPFLYVTVYLCFCFPFSVALFLPWLISLVPHWFSLSFYPLCLPLLLRLRLCLCLCLSLSLFLLSLSLSRHLSELFDGVKVRLFHDLLVSPSLAEGREARAPEEVQHVPKPLSCKTQKIHKNSRQDTR